MVIIGKMELNESVIKSVNENLESHELIKIKFNQHKDLKTQIINTTNKRTNSESIGMIGNVAIIFRQNIDLEKQIYKID